MFKLLWSHCRNITVNVFDNKIVYDIPVYSEIIFKYFMTSENKTQIQEQQQIFGADDFVFTNQINKDGKSEFVGGGYKVDSFLLNNNMCIYACV